MLAPVGEATWGEDRLLELALASHRVWPGVRRRARRRPRARDVGLLELGALHVALDRDEAAELRRRYELMVSHGLEAEWLAPSACRELEPGLGSGGHGGVHAPHEAAVDPRTLVAALADCVRARRRARSRSPRSARALFDGARLAGVRTDRRDASTAPAAVVLAAGAWSAADWLPPEARPHGAAGQGPDPHPAPAPPRRPLCERIVVTERVYLVPRADGRLIVGATVEEQGFDDRITAGGGLRAAARGLPGAAGDRRARAGRGERRACARRRRTTCR